MANYFNAALTNTKLLIGDAGDRHADYLSVYNPGASDAFVQFFDAAATADVTLGTTAPAASYWVPAVAARSEDIRLRCSKGLVIAATTTVTGAAAPAAALLVEHMEYS